MIGILVDGLEMFVDHNVEILVFLVTAFGLGKLFIKSPILIDINDTIKLFFAICLGVIAICGVTFIIAIISHFMPMLFKPIGVMLISFSLFIIIKDIVINKLNFQNPISFLLVVLTLLFLLFLRLPFLNHILLPGYSDSPIHYQIIVQILNPNDEINTNLSIGNIFTNYYHFGFHSLTAWLSAITGIDPAKAMSLIGQFSLVLASISTATFTFILTKNTLGAISAGLLSIFGWSMPAFAVNWGKFPALLSMALIPIVLSYAASILEIKSKKSLLIFFLLLTGIFVIHTRSIAIILLALGSLLLTRILKYKENPGLLFSIKVSVLFLILLIPLKEYIFTYYERYPLAILIILLLPFAFFHYSKETTWVFFFISSIWSIQFLSKLLFDSFEFLDTQYISIMLFIPFSVLGGLGIAGIIKQIPIFLKPLIAITFILTVIYNSPWKLSTFPDPCCDYYTQEDDDAFKWINENVSTNSLFIISTFSDGNQQFGSDAGIWITPLKKLHTNKLAYDTNWNDSEVFPQKCNSNLREVYIYSGGKDYSFSNNVLLSLNWVELIYNSNSTSIYKVSKCMAN